MKLFKKYFKKELFNSEKDERNFKRANKCYLCNKLYTEKDITVRYFILLIKSVMLIAD